MNDPVISIDNVNKRYVQDEDAQAALDGVSLEVGSGEFVAIMGQSGSGKTTLLNLVGGLDRDYTGEIKVVGHDLAQMTDAKLSRLRNESIGFVFQAYHLLPQLSCAENVGLPALFREKPVNGLDKKITDALSKVNLTDRKSDPPTSLSGGQKQRVAIARALLLQPQLLLCDEPTGNLDQQTGRELMSVLKRLSDSDGLTIVLVTHEKHIGEACDRIIRLQDGKIIENEGGEA